MTFRGTFRNGKIELDESPTFQEGERVDVQSSRPKKGSVYRLYEMATKGDRLPKDYASEIDHYLYGTPKRNGKKVKKSAAVSAKRRSPTPKKSTKKRSR